MKRIYYVTAVALLLLTFVSCAFHEPGTIVVDNGTVLDLNADTTATETVEETKESVSTDRETTTKRTTSDVAVKETEETMAETTAEETTTLNTREKDTTAEATEETTSETDTTAEETTVEPDQSTMTFVLNTNTKKFHLPTCRYVKNIKESNRKEVVGIDQLIDDSGYEPCKVCLPDFKFKID